jgi:hypothetical protein
MGGEGLIRGNTMKTIFQGDMMEQRIERARKALTEAPDKDLVFLIGAVAMHISSVRQWQEEDGGSMEQFHSRFQAMFDERLLAMGLDSDARDAMGSMVLDILSYASGAVTIEKRPRWIHEVLGG